MDTIHIEIKGKKGIITRICNWRAGIDAPECSASLPAGDALSFVLDGSIFGEVKAEGDLEIDTNASRGSVRAFRWSPEAKADGQGNCEVTFVHPRTGFEDIVMSVSLDADAAICVENDGSEQYSSGNELVDRYGAYIVGFLGAIGALVASVFMPHDADTLLGAAGALALLTFFNTEVYEAYALRALGLLGAGAALVVAYFLPEHSAELLSTAGAIAVLSILCT